MVLNYSSHRKCTPSPTDIEQNPSVGGLWIPRSNTWQLPVSSQTSLLSPTVPALIPPALGCPLPVRTSAPTDLPPAILLSMSPPSASTFPNGAFSGTPPWPSCSRFLSLPKHPEPSYCHPCFPKHQAYHTFYLVVCLSLLYCGHREGRRDSTDK